MERRNTIQKDLILQAVQELKCHATAAEIFSFVSQKYPSVSAGTVYRNLGLLSEEGLIRRVVIPGEADKFDHDVSHHYHMKCIKCGKISDIKIQEIPDIIRKVNPGTGAKLIDYDILFRGVCPDCIKKTKGVGKKEK